MAVLRLAVLASGKGSNLRAIIDGCCNMGINASIVAVFSDREAAGALKIAADFGIEACYVDPKGFSCKQHFEDTLLRKISLHQVDYIILAGYMRILSPYFIKNAGCPVLNIHPSLLPSFPGLNAQEQAIRYGVRFSGCTVHFVDEGIDSGPIIMQAVVPVLQEDTEEALTKRILNEEHRIYPYVIKLLAEKRILCQGRKVIIREESDNNEKTSFDQCVR